MIDFKNIYEFIKQAETDYRTAYAEPIEGYRWNMYNHIRRSALYKIGEIMTGKTDMTVVRNIVLPLVRLQYRLEGFNVSDVILFARNPELFYRSKILRYYHEDWAIENHIDKAIDDSVESDVDYGLKLLKRTNKKAPEVVRLTSLAFADQNDIMSAPIGIRHDLSLSQILDEKKWFDKSASVTRDAFIELAKNNSSNDYKSRGKITIYEVRGVMTQSWLTSGEGFVRQIHVIATVFNKDKQKSYVTLFKTKAGDDIKAHSAREEISGRSCHLGGVEELFDPQMWTSYSETRLREMLDEAAKTIYKTTDRKFGQRESLKNAKTGQVFYVDGDLSQIDNAARDQAAFQSAVDRWFVTAQGLSDAHSALRGESPTAGTPAALQELVVGTGKGQHDYRQEKNADFWGEVYDEWILPTLGSELSSEKEFFAELPLQVIQETARNLAQNLVNRKLIRSVLDKKGVPRAEEIEAFRNANIKSLSQGGSSRFLKILQDEFRGEKLGVKFSIANRQANITKNMTSLVNIFRTIATSGGQILNAPGMGELFNQIIELSGLSPVDFTSFAQAQPQAAAKTEPTEELIPA